MFEGSTHPSHYSFSASYPSFWQNMRSHFLLQHHKQPLLTIQPVHALVGGSDAPKDADPFVMAVTSRISTLLHLQLPYYPDWA